MTINDELKAVEGLIQEAEHYAAQHIQQIIEIYNLNTIDVIHFEEYLKKTLSIANSTINLCRSLALNHGCGNKTSENDLIPIIQKLIEGVIESLSAMYLSMAFIDHLKSPVDAPIATEIKEYDSNHKSLRCSFCNKDCKDVMAGPSVNICSSCIRLASAILGMKL